MDIHRDTSKAIEQRVEDLIALMTLDEKIAQLGSTYADVLLENGRFSAGLATGVMGDGIGHISAMGRTSALPAQELAVLSNDIQHYLAEGTRLGIPAVIHEECLNGYRAKGATIFPQNIGLASTWDTELVNRMTRTIRRQMRSTGVHQGLAPVLDVARDPRWGRTEETFGEDPFLVAEMGMAYIRGLQGDDPARGIAATVKHFAGHGLPEGGLNCAPSHIPPRLLREVYFYPFEKAIKKAGVLSLMNAYHELDGVPCGASEELLTRILHEEWGFDGLVVSDYYAIGQLITVHHICEDIGDAVHLALKAGIDLELPKSHGFARPLQEQVEKGLVDIGLVDRAVRRVLSFKFRLGIFDNPYVETGRPIDIDMPDDRALALEAARKSIVLLKNERNRLPLEKTISSIAVIGPNADSVRSLLGDYTYPAGAGYELSTNEKTGRVETVWKDRDMLEGRIAEPHVVSVLEGVRQVVSPSTSVVYHRGCEVTGNDASGIAEAVNAARQADVAVVVVGGMSSMIPQGTSGEMRDSMTLQLPGVQERLVKAVVDTGMPVVLVVVSGRPHVLGWMADDIDAIVYAWLPGEEGGRAVAEILFGDCNPSGKLPVSLPVHAGQVPAYYAHKPSGGRSSLWGDYTDGPVKPRFQFGHGLSFTTFEYSNLSIRPGCISSYGAVEISLDIMNTGDMAGDEVVQ
ncbi:MAG TPA: beta-glucosidase, partial [Spirochaetes bacterium]|nr:beta-glucosidase [Spirochaetota bacterium]